MSVKLHHIKDMHAAKGALGPNSNSYKRFIVERQIRLAS